MGYGKGCLLNQRATPKYMVYNKLRSSPTVMTSFGGNSAFFISRKKTNLRTGMKGQQPLTNLPKINMAMKNQYIKLVVWFSSHYTVFRYRNRYNFNHESKCILCFLFFDLVVFLCFSVRICCSFRFGRRCLSLSYHPSNLQLRTCLSFGLLCSIGLFRTFNSICSFSLRCTSSSCCPSH